MCVYFLPNDSPSPLVNNLGRPIFWLMFRETLMSLLDWSEIHLISDRRTTLKKIGEKKRLIDELRRAFITIVKD